MKSARYGASNLGRRASLAMALASASLIHACTDAAAQLPASRWVATWQASPQPVWGTDFLFPSNVPAELRDQTVRQIARVSLGGQRLRIVLSNAYVQAPIVVGKASVGRAAGTAADGAADAQSLRGLTFSGRAQAMIPPGASLLSDPVALPLGARERVVVSLYLPQATPSRSFHWDGRQTGWIVAGDQTLAPLVALQAPTSQSTTARLLLTGIQVEAPVTARTVAVIGDSITDGATASLDTDSRWPDFLAARFAADGVAVVNAGISGAQLLSDGMGVNALARLDRDVLVQPGLASIVVLLGINDIAWPGTAFAPEAQRPTLETLTAGYRQLIEQAHSHGVRVIGATLAPFEGALPDTPLANYYNPDKDALRQQVNAWIRDSGAFDAVIDFDAVLRDPAHQARIAEAFDSGDHLHPGDAGNRAMAEAVDLDALLPNRHAASVSQPTEP